MTYDVNDFGRTLPGDVFFTQVGMPGKATIIAGQAAIGDSNRFHHVGIAIGEGLLAEARPPAARIIEIDPVHDSLWYRLPLTDQQRNELVINVKSDFQSGAIKYGWANYGYLSLARLGIRPRWLKDQIGRSSRRICSQLVDDQLTRVNFPVLEGVLPGQVTPGDLEYRLAHDPEITPFRLDGNPPYHWVDLA